MADAGSTDGGWRCVFVVAGAYLVQGLIAALGVLIVQLLAQRGVPLEAQAGLLASGAAPWVLKFVLALALDLGPSLSFRARAIVLGLLQAGAAAGVWTLAAIWADAPVSLLALSLGWIGLNACAATQDVIVDALALDTLGDRRPAAAGAMAIGSVLGFAVLDPFVVRPRMLAEGVAAGLRLPAIWIAALALVTAALLWIPGRPIKAREQAPARTRAPGDLAWLLWIPAVFVAASFANNLTAAIAPTFMFGELDWDIESYGLLIMPVAAIAGLVGAFAWGPVVARLGPARAAMLGSAALGLVWLGFAAASPLWSQRWVFVVMAGGEGVLQQALLVSLHAIALLAAARSPMPTTAFVIAMAAINLPRVLAPLLAPYAVELGWVGIFAACGLWQIVVGAGLWPLRGWHRVGAAAT